MLASPAYSGAEVRDVSKGLTETLYLTSGREVTGFRWRLKERAAVTTTIVHLHRSDLRHI